MKIRHIYRYALNCLFQGITWAQTNLIRAPLTQHSINELTLGQNGGKQMALKQVLGWEPRRWHYVERAFRNTHKRQPHVLGLILKFHPCSRNQHKKGPSEAFAPQLHWQKKRSRPTMVTPSSSQGNRKNKVQTTDESHCALQLNMDKTEKARQKAREPTQIANRPKTKGQLAKTLEQGPFYLPPRSIMQSWVNKKTDP